jgi:3-hydroxyacyl-[acyl-carrier-protein] dehydratase
MSQPLMTVEQVQACLQQRYPMLMVDSVISLEPGKSIRAIKNVTANELHSPGGSPFSGAMPCSLIVEAIGQAASILFAETMGMGTSSDEFLVLGSIDQMCFPAPVVSGDRLEIEVRVLKFIAGLALVEAKAWVEETTVAKGKVGFARQSLQALRSQLSDSKSSE